MHQGQRRFQAGFLAAVLAAMLQLTLWVGAVSGNLTPAEATIATLAANQCGESPAQHHHQHGLPCSACPVCLGATMPAALLAPAPVLAPPRLLIVLRIARPGGARAPPALALQTAYPRGPPIA